MVYRQGAGFGKAAGAGSRTRNRSRSLQRSWKPTRPWSPSPSPAATPRTARRPIRPSAMLSRELRWMEDRRHRRHARRRVPVDPSDARRLLEEV